MEGVFAAGSAVGGPWLRGRGGVVASAGRKLVFPPRPTTGPGIAAAALARRCQSDSLHITGRRSRARAAATTAESTSEAPARCGLPRNQALANRKGNGDGMRREYPSLDSAATGED